MNLENKNFVEKTIKKVKLRNGSCVTEQEDVLHHIKKYYETLFKSHDDNLETTAFKNFDILGKNKYYFDIGGERLRHTLDNIISNCQTGFIKGRFLNDSTRLKYDVLHVTEKRNIPGLLILIDFEKAFDSLSWTFLYDTLESFGYGTD